MMKKGASLIWALVMSTALLFIAVTVANFIISESKMSIRMDDSSRAYAAAESGIEWGKFCLQTPATCPDQTYPVFYLDTSQYTVTISGGGKKIESIGAASGVNRKLEYVVTGNQPLDTVKDISQGFTVSGSYVQQFDYWTDGIAAGGNIGISNGITGVGEKSIYFEHNGGQIHLSAKNGATVLQSTKSVATAGIDFNSTDQYVVRVRIEYTKDLSAKMTVAIKNFSGTGSDFNCVSPIMVLDLRSFGISYKDLTKFYFSDTPVANNGGDGAIYKFSGSNVYFDNMSTKGITQKLTNYTLTYAAGGNGAISGASPQTVAGGANGAQVTATPNPGFRFVSWSDGSVQNPRQDMNVASDISVTATFDYIKIPVYQFWSATYTDHLYTTSLSPPEFTSGGWPNYDGPAFNSADPALPGAVPIYRYWNNTLKDHFFTTNSNNATFPTWGPEGVAFYGFPASATPTSNVYQFYNGTIFDHYYSTSPTPPGGYGFDGPAFLAK